MNEELYRFALYWKGGEVALFTTNAQDGERITKELRIPWGHDEHIATVSGSGRITLLYQSAGTKAEPTPLPRIDVDECIARIAAGRHDLLDEGVSILFTAEMREFERELTSLLCVINREPVSEEELHELREGIICTD